MRHWLFNILIALDRLLNAFCWGSPNETLSSRAYRMSVEGHLHWCVFAAIVDSIFFWEAEHCKTSWRRNRVLWRRGPN